MMIPKIFHQVWLGSKAVPAKFQEYRNKLIELHSDWEHKFWTDENVDQLLLGQPDSVVRTYNFMQNYAGKADVIRWLALKEFGGMYLDMDIEPHNSFDDWVKDDMLTELIFDCPFFEGDIQNCIMGFEPNHLIFDAMNNDCWLHILGSIAYRTVDQTGPFFLQKHINILNEKLDKPIEYISHEKLGKYMTHHFTFSWKSDPPISYSPLRYENTKTPISTFVWFTCKRDFNCLKLSIKSAKQVMGNRLAYYVVQDKNRCFSESQIKELKDIGAEIYNGYHLGVYGVKPVHTLVKIMFDILQKTQTPYATKIDSDCLLFGTRFEKALQRGVHPFVATWAEWGFWGPFAHYRYDAIKRMLALTLEKFEWVGKTFSNRPNILPEDETLSHIIANEFLSDYSSQKHFKPMDLYPLFLEKPNYQGGFFNVFNPGRFTPASTYRAQIEYRSFLTKDRELDFLNNFAEMPDDKISYYDCIEFGRKAEYPYPNGTNADDYPDVPARDASKVQFVEAVMEYVYNRVYCD